MSASTLKFLAYKAINSTMVTMLRNNNYEVYYTAAADSTITEDHLSQLANKENYILITGDENFGEKMYNEGRVQAGIISLRIKENDDALYGQRVVDAVTQNAAQLPFAYSVITNKDVKTKKFGTV